LHTWFPAASVDWLVENPMAITTQRSLLTDAWTGDVETLETAIGRFKASGPSPNDCQVAFFEIVHDRHLHVNVTHRHPTKGVRGWAGPANVAGGFLHNRTFADAAPPRMLRQIREMVLAAQI
jgi:hypothetical protein